MPRGGSLSRNKNKNADGTAKPAGNGAASEPPNDPDKPKSRAFLDLTQDSNSDDDIVFTEKMHKVSQSVKDKNVNKSGASQKGKVVEAKLPSSLKRSLKAKKECQDSKENQNVECGNVTNVAGKSVAKKKSVASKEVLNSKKAKQKDVVAKEHESTQENTISEGSKKADGEERKEQGTSQDEQTQESEDDLEELCEIKAPVKRVKLTQAKKTKAAKDGKKSATEKKRKEAVKVSVSSLEDPNETNDFSGGTTPYKAVAIKKIFQEEQEKNRKKKGGGKGKTKLKNFSKQMLEKPVEEGTEKEETGYAAGARTTQSNSENKDDNGRLPIIGFHELMSPEHYISYFCKISNISSFYFLLELI